MSPSRASHDKNFRKYEFLKLKKKLVQKRLKCFEIYNDYFILLERYGWPTRTIRIIIMKKKDYIVVTQRDPKEPNIVLASKRTIRNTVVAQRDNSP